jgi:hypothetical protein
LLIWLEELAVKMENPLESIIGLAFMISYLLLFILFLKIQEAKRRGHIHVKIQRGSPYKNKKPDPYCQIAPRESGYNSSVDFGNPAIPMGPVAFRPPIARSLALSVFI